MGAVPSWASPDGVAVGCCPTTERRAHRLAAARREPIEGRSLKPINFDRSDYSRLKTAFSSQCCDPTY